MKWFESFFKRFFSWSTNNNFYYVQEELKYEQARAQHDYQITRTQNKAS